MTDPKSSMDEQRLSRMSTQWSMVIQAHGESETRISPARAELLERYQRPVFRYLLGAVRNADVAEELSQEFAVKLLEGRFRNVAPDKGRFRDYLKRSLSNLVNEHFRRQAKNPGQLPEQMAQPPGSPVEDELDRFDRDWRAEVMERTWQSLLENKPLYHSLLKIRIENPSLTSREIAEEHRRRGGKEITSAYVRKVLERSHAMFARLLVEEVASLIEDPDRESLKSELDALDLTRYCRSALENWNG